VLGNETDADDAFQAVFLVFLRKAEKVRPGNLLGNWLYGVAVNVARKGRELAARRRFHETAAVQGAPVAYATGSPETAELREVIDQELSRLPADYRAAVVTCDLEGRTRREAAGQLGWSEGTVASRLARARSILAERLTRRGFVMPAAGLAVALPQSVSAALPAVPLVGHSAAVETLAHQAMRAMTTSKLKTTVMVVLAVAGLSGIGTGMVLAFGGAGAPPVTPPASSAKPATDRPADKPAEAKPSRFVLKNPAGDITVFSDRDEKLVEFFRRQRVMVAGVTKKDFTTAAGATRPTDKVFVNYSSQNDDSVLNATYGAYVRLTPIRAELVEMIPDPDKSALVLVPDAKQQDVWHVVGFTTRSSVGFFTLNEKGKGDDFAPADLLFVKKK
jgi:RNA polymerase sigma factor (sigma-70 family)